MFLRKNPSGEKKKVRVFKKQLSDPPARPGLRSSYGPWLCSPKRGAQVPAFLVFLIAVTECLTEITRGRKDLFWSTVQEILDVMADFDRQLDGA